MGSSGLCKVFHAVPVVVVGFKSDAQLTVLPVPSYDGTVDPTQQTFEIDLRRTPSRCAWDDVEIDDRGVDATNRFWPAQMDSTLLELGVTSIGSGATGTQRDHLLRSAFVGAVYVEHSRYEKLAITNNPAKYPWPPAQFPGLYQLTSIAFRANTADACAGKRYHGFCCTVVDAKDTLVSVQSTIPGSHVLGPWWIDTANPNECLARPPQEALGAFPRGHALLTGGRLTPGQTGAIFVSLPHAVGLGMAPAGPKIPIGEA